MLKLIKKEINRKLNKFSVYREQDIKIHPDSYLGSNTIIGRGTSINGPAFIASSKNAPVEIGKYCAIAHDLKIRPRNHFTGYVNLQDKLQDRHQFPKLESIKGPVIIGNNVWIGDRVTILSGVTIGDGAVLGAGSIVTKNIPPYTIAVGSPAQVIKKRFSDEIIQQLLQIKWWDCSEDKIKLNQQFFTTDFSQNFIGDIHSIIID
jgi:virginiamycin A acetyltransferase